MRIAQLIPPVGEGWRAVHYDPDDDEVYEVPIVAWALVESDGAQQIHAVGMYDLAATLKADEPFSFTDEDSTFMELAPPPGTLLLEEDEAPGELVERVRRYAQKRRERAGQEEGVTAEQFAPAGG